MSGFLDDLKGRVNGALTRNAAQFARFGERLADLPRIRPEERARASAEAQAAGVARAEDNVHDARRHARASARLTRAVGPGVAALAGYGDEAWDLGRNLVDNAVQLAGGAPAPSFGAALASSRMDLRNNAEGRRAVREGRPIDPRRLQTSPGRTPDYSFVYDPRPDGLRTTAPR